MKLKLCRTVGLTTTTLQSQTLPLKAVSPTNQRILAMRLSAPCQALPHH